MLEQIALNLRPGDEIEVDGNWWIVRQHSICFNDPAPVRLDLRQREHDPVFLTLLTPIGQKFYYEPYDPGF